jgi:hypothetical protein
LFSIYFIINSSDVAASISFGPSKIKPALQAGAANLPDGPEAYLFYEEQPL